MFHPVDPAELERVWPRIERQVQSQCKKYQNGMNAKAVRAEIYAGSIGLMVWGSGWCLLRVTSWPEFKTLDVLMIGGDGMDAWLDDLIKELKRLARQHSCKFIQEQGREGWLKTLGRHGFQKHLITMRCEV